MPSQQSRAVIDLGSLFRYGRRSQNPQFTNQGGHLLRYHSYAVIPKSFHEKAGTCQDGFFFFLPEIFFV
jgi:hypothetical protein